MADIYKQTFDSLSDGGLNGQDSWTYTTADWTVQTSTTYNSSAKAISAAGATNQIDRNITGNLTGYYQLAVRRSSSATGTLEIYLFRQGWGSLCIIQLDASGNINQYAGGWNADGTYSANTWYLVEIQWDQPNNQYRFRIDGGTWKTWRSMGGQTTVDAIRITHNNSGVTDYIDEVWLTDDGVYGGGGGGTTSKRLALLGVG